MRGFAWLSAQVGRLRQEPIGLDRDRREYMVLGGPPDGQQPLADAARLLVRKRAADKDSVEEWCARATHAQTRAHALTCTHAPRAARTTTPVRPPPARTTRARRAHRAPRTHVRALTRSRAHVQERYALAYYDARDCE
eukprot:722332-Pleurochrysis_carterae.AAC.1